MIPDKISLEIGDSFLFRNENGNHLHVIVADVSPDDNDQVMLIYLSSVDAPYKDTTTIVEIGEHEFVTKKSWVRYQNVIVCKRKSIYSSIIKHYGKISPKLLEKIVSGLIKSKRTPNNIKDLFQEWKMNKAYRQLNT